MKIWHISDTHSYHWLLNIPEDIDLIIHSGDCSNYKDPFKNEKEIEDFIDWFSQLDITYKIYVAGNHDTSIEKNLIKSDNFERNGIIYLENDFVNIESIKIYGSPITPTFGDWSFMKSRDKIHKIWDNIPEDINILITHGPPKGILDISENRLHQLEFCGCSNLRKQLDRFEQLKLSCFGHIHNFRHITNSGIRKMHDYKAYFSNGSVVNDGEFGYLTSNGNVFELKNNKIEIVK